MRKKISLLLAVLGAWSYPLGVEAQDKPEIFLQLGHATVVRSVAFSPDGKLLASGNGDNTVKLWNMASGRELRILSGHSGAVNSVAFSPDARMLASGSSDNTVKLWEIASGCELRTFNGHSNAITSVAFSPNGRIVASGSDDGMARIWDVASGNDRVSLVAFMDGSSLILTPEGYYDASSAKAEENLNVRLGNRVFPVGHYRDKFYRPDLVKLSLAGNLLSRFAGISNVKLAPTIEFIDLPASTSESKLTVNLRITDGGDGIGLVRLFLNGTAVVQDDISSRGGPPIMRSYAVELANGSNELRAVAFNADDSMESSSPVASIVANLTPAGRSNLYAVVAGIQESKNPKYNLKYSVADAQLIAETFQKYSAQLFQKVDIKLLITPAETTRDSLIQSLKGMQAVVGVNDVFVFYVASHGVVADNGEYFLITSNVDSGSTEALKTEALSQADLAALLADIPSSKKMVILDTAHAEAPGNALEAGLLTEGMNEGAAAKVLSRDIGVTVLAAATTEEEVLEGYKDHGLFTYVVADGLAGGADLLKQGIVTNTELAAYVEHAVPRLAENLYHHNQNPTADIIGREFPLTKVK